jgi:hypothetical protein
MNLIFRMLNVSCKRFIIVEMERIDIEYCLYFFQVLQRIIFVIENILFLSLFDKLFIDGFSDFFHSVLCLEKVSYHVLEFIQNSVVRSITNRSPMHSFFVVDCWLVAIITNPLHGGVCCNPFSFCLVGELLKVL